MTVAFALRSDLLLLAGLALGLGSLPAQTPPVVDLKLPAVISDHMVLQEGVGTNLWGWAPAGTSVQAEFLGGDGKTLVTAGCDTTPVGRWSMQLPILPPGTVGSLRFTAGTTVKTIQDVVVGEVWLGGGQSNMAYNLGWPNTFPKEMLDTARNEVIAANGAIRFFIVGGYSANIPKDDVFGAWVPVTPDNFKDCSAVAWNFAVALREKIPAPVGMIVSAAGGTSVTQWMPKAALDSSPPGPEIEKNDLQAAADAAPKLKAWQDADNEWLAANPTPALQEQNKAARPVRTVWPPRMFSELYNTMIHGLAPYTIKGVIWFQADGDVGTPYAYGDLIKSMIVAWRADWGTVLPFLYVEMNNMNEYPPKDPNQGNDPISILRQQQQAALELPLTDVACSIDLGFLAPDPHFANKKPVGQRLALLAFNDVYNMPCAAHSPAFHDMAIEGNKLRLHFTYAEGLRVRGGGDAVGFEIRGATGPWVWARAQVDGQDMLVWNDQIPNPIEVHYAWSPNPLNSMENGAGLPMRPFSTASIRP